MNRSELIKRVAEKHPQLSPLYVREAVKEILVVMANALASGERIEIRDFGAFKLRMFGATSHKNFQTGDKVFLDPRPRVRFKPGKGMRDRVREGV